MSLKQGQLAHLDQNSANPAEDNIAFMCFDHHDTYDSTTRQSKNLTEREVRAYRDELYRDNDVFFGLPSFVSFLWVRLLGIRRRR